MGQLSIHICADNSSEYEKQQSIL